jgi:hypothetical protein
MRDCRAIGSVWRLCVVLVLSKVPLVPVFSVFFILDTFLLCLVQTSRGSLCNVSSGKSELSLIPLLGSLVLTSSRCGAAEVGLRPSSTTCSAGLGSVAARAVRDASSMLSTSLSAEPTEACSSEFAGVGSTAGVAVASDAILASAALVSSFFFCFCNQTRMVFRSALFGGHESASTGEWSHNGHVVGNSSFEWPGP